MKTITGHGSIILSLMYLTFLIVDRYNPAMSFINNDITKTLLLLLCIFSVYNASTLLKRERDKVRRREEKRRQETRARRASGITNAARR